MAKEPNVIKELKDLGKELGGALTKMRSSQEFKHLEREFADSVKSISKSLAQSLQAASKSESAQSIRKQLGKVVEAGATQGKAEAKRAQAAAAAGIRKVTVAVKKMTKRAKKQQP